MKSKNLTVPIAIVSVAIPVVVAILFYLPRPNIEVGFNVSILPLFHAILNSATAILLLASLYFIKQGQRKAHQVANLSAVALSVVFLLSYVTYHFLTVPTKYGGEGIWRGIYYFILLTHILLAAVIVPLVLFSLLRAYQGDFNRHRKIARITWPLWFYVAVTGVIVYVMISPYY